MQSMNQLVAKHVGSSPAQTSLLAQSSFSAVDDDCNHTPSTRSVLLRRPGIRREQSWRHFACCGETVEAVVCRQGEWRRITRIASSNRTGPMRTLYFAAVVSSCPFFFFSSPNLSGRRLDVCHTSTHDVALVRI